MVSFQDFSFQYKSQQTETLKHINLEIYEGEKVLILGPSGSGKSTLGYCINGLIPNQYPGTIQGSCTVKGKDIRTTRIFDLSKIVGSVLQDSDAQFVGLNVAEDIAFALENQAVPREEMKNRVHEAARIVNLTEFLNAFPSDLSGGQKQRVSVAGVLHGAIDLLLFDEPLASLDPHMGEVMIELIDTLNKAHHKTVVMIEHRLEDVLHRDVDRVILMDKGEIIFNGTADGLIVSGLLIKHGIREPLYISAIRQFFRGLSQTEHLTSLKTIDLAELKKAPLKIHGFKPIDAQKKPLIELHGIKFSYDAPLIDIDLLTISRGEKISIIGENGAGKTTLARLLTGVIRPQEGRILLEGQDTSVLSIREIAQQIGYVMQNPNQMLVKSFLLEEVSVALELNGFSKDEIEQKAGDALRLAGIYTMRNWPIQALSYGQRKRLTIAVVLALNPSVLILDEPTAGQDYAHYRDIMSFVDNLNRSNGTTILFITHDLHLALEYTERSIVLVGGKVVADQPTLSLFDPFL